MRRFAILSAVLLLLPAASLIAGEITDAHIASIVVTANQVDVDAGAFVASRTNNAEVKSFAELMVTDHKAVNHAATELVTKLKLTPRDNPTSQSLKADGHKNLAALKKLDGATLDQAYVDHEVAYHQQVIEALDGILIPSATNAELKSLLVKVRPAFVAHLEHAKALQTAMARRHS
jgi:putative membrane protein